MSRNLWRLRLLLDKCLYINESLKLHISGKTRGYATVLIMHVFLYKNCKICSYILIYVFILVIFGHTGRDLIMNFKINTIILKTKH